MATKQRKPLPTPQIVQGCFICGATSCELITHRLLTLESRRRLSKKNKHTSSNRTSKRHFSVDSVCNRSEPDLSLIVSPSSPLDGRLDPFLPFPVKKVKKHLVGHFHDFFSAQGRSVYNADRNLSFDSGHYPYLLPGAVRNPALCMSLIAMAATYTGIHGRNLTAPDTEVLSVYTQSFQKLREQIDKETPTGISETSIMAAINLMMCCGVAFRDPEATLIHWHGVQALFHRPEAKFYSGPLVAFFDNLEHWLVLTCDAKPRVERWIRPFPHERPPPQVYGRAFLAPFQSSVFQAEPLMSRLLELCLNTCRATEILESDALVRTSNPKASPTTYFGYLRGVVADQGMNIYSNFANTDTVGECLSITLSIFYLCVLRLSPWKAPLRHLLSRLRRALLNCVLMRSDEMFCSGPHFGDDSLSDDGECQVGLKDIYIWMLFLSACAAQLCQDQIHISWVNERIQKVYVPALGKNKKGWRTNLLHDLKAFCWSEMFLSKHLQMTCSALEYE